MSISVETLALAKKNTKQAVEEAVTSVYRYKGSVETFEDLPTSGQKVGDVYNVEKEAGRNYAWDGNDWDALGIAENLGDIEFTGADSEIKTINEDFWDKNKVQEELDDVSNVANSAYDKARAAHNKANDASDISYTAYNQANAAYDQANAAYDTANAAYDTANAAYDTLNDLGNVKFNITSVEKDFSNYNTTYQSKTFFKGVDSNQVCDNEIIIKCNSSDFTIPRTYTYYGLGSSENYVSKSGDWGYLTDFMTKKDDTIIVKIPQNVNNQFFFIPVDSWLSNLNPVLTYTLNYNTINDLGNIHFNQYKISKKVKSTDNSNDIIVYNDPGYRPVQTECKIFKGIDVKDIMAYDKVFPDDTNIPFAIFEVENLEESGIVNDPKFNASNFVAKAIKMSAIDSPANYGGSRGVDWIRVPGTNKFTGYNIKSNYFKQQFNDLVYKEKAQYLSSTFGPRTILYDVSPSNYSPTNERYYDLKGTLTYYSAEAGKHVSINMDYYDKDDVDNLINNADNDTLNAAKAYTDSKFDISLKKEVVQELPAEGEEDILYLVPKVDAETEDVYDEYIWTNNAWEKIGSTATDLSNYYTSNEVDALLNTKVDKDEWAHTYTITNNGSTPSIMAVNYSKLYVSCDDYPNNTQLILTGNTSLDITNNLSNHQPIDISDADLIDIQYTGDYSNITLDVKLVNEVIREKQYKSDLSAKADITNVYTSNQVDNIASNLSNNISNISNVASNAQNSADQASSAAANAQNDATNALSDSSNASNVANDAYNLASNASNSASNANTLAQAAYDAANSLAPAAWQEVANVTTNEVTNSVTLPLDEEYDEYIVVFNEPIKMDGSTPADSLTDTTGALKLKLGGQEIGGGSLELYNKMKSIYKVTKITNNVYYTECESRILYGGNSYSHRQDIHEIGTKTNANLTLEMTYSSIAQIESGVTVKVYGKNQLVKEAAVEEGELIV